MEHIRPVCVTNITAASEPATYRDVGDLRAWVVGSEGPGPKCRKVNRLKRIT